MRWRFILAILVLAFSISGGMAYGQGVDGLDCERFKPVLDSQGVFNTEGGKGDLAGELNLGFYIHYSRNPMMITSGDGTMEWSLVADRVAGNFFVSMGMTDWLSLAVDVPAVFFQNGGVLDQTTSQDIGLAEAALGDIRVVPKLTVLREETHGVSLAFVLPVSLPSGDDAAFVGSKSVTASPTIAASRRLIDGRLLLALNFGAWLLQEADYRDLSVGHEMFYRIGAGFQLAEKWWALGEVTSAGKIENLFENDPKEVPLEWFLGARFHGPRDLTFTAGGAVGSLPGWGTPHFRLFFGMTWAPRDHDSDGDGIVDSQDKCPNEPGPRENHGCPWGDRDGDTVPDNHDKCPEQPGSPNNEGCPWGDADNDGIKDNEDKCPKKAGPAENHGCPWGDADGDGVTDNLDKCPKKPGPAENKGCPWGDKDGDNIKDNVDKCPDQAGPADNDGCPYGDADGDGIKDEEDKCPKEPGPVENQGCPWGDTDEDGILDNLDKCPKDPEDKDGFEDQDGCPDPDNDKDGIPDEKDKCPDEPETINGVQDDDGCPDQGKVVVIVKKEKIEILQKVHFESGKARILPDSYSLLNQVAQVLKGHSEIKKLRVDGHTDSIGSERYNQRLSERRAKSVKDYLIKKGIEPGRLESQGWGESKPIAPNDTRRGREANRRVEFMILEKD